MIKVKEKLNTFKNRLVKINDEEPLSKLSLFVIIALDIFILFVVFGGLADHTRQLTSPGEYVTYECRKALIEKDWIDDNRISQLQGIALRDHGDYSYRYDSIFKPDNLKQMHPICRQFYEKLAAISKDTELVRLFKKRKKLEEEKEQYKGSFKGDKDVYDTSLLENIAATPNKEKLASISDEMKSKALRIETYNAEILEIEKQINNHPLVIDLWTFINVDHKPILLKALKKFEFWYPFKTLLWQFLFLLPLFIIFYIWNMRSVKKDHQLQVLISSHLIVIAAIPMLFKIIEIVLDLIPHHFFENLFNILEALNIIALWHYFVIIGAIIAALLSIYIIQKKIFNKRRLELKRLMKGACYSCGKRLPMNSPACPFCGKVQHTKCGSCNNEMYVAGEYCNLCGKINEHV